MWTPGPMELVIILIIVLLLFGKRLPEVMRSLGKGVVEFKKGVRGETEDAEEEKKGDAESSSTPQPTGDKEHPVESK